MYILPNRLIKTHFHQFRHFLILLAGFMIHCCLILQKIQETTDKEVNIIAVSSSSTLALEMILQSQKSEKSIRTLTLLQGSLYLMKAASKDVERNTYEFDIICEFAEKYIPGSRQKVFMFLMVSINPNIKHTCLSLNYNRFKIVIKLIIS